MAKNNLLGGAAESLIQTEWSRYNLSGPGKPPPKQTNAKIRTFDYPAFYNTIQGLPIGGESNGVSDYNLTFEECREFATHEIVRSVIETCKDQLCKLRWTWRITPRPGMTIQEVRDESENDVRCKVLNLFFKRPDREHTFKQWLRIMLEEILVCDTAPIWKQERMDGLPYALRIVDTETIRRCIDDMGVTPEPDLPYPANIAYQQVIQGMVNEEFTSDEMLYYIRNPRVNAFYGQSPVEQIAITLITGMHRMAMQLNHYTEGNVPAMFLRAPKEWTLDQIKEFQIYWNELLSGNLGELSKGWMIPGDIAPDYPQKENLKDDFDEWIARVCCYAYSVSPNAFIKNLNRATSEQAREQADEEGLQSRMAIVTEIMDTIQEKWFGFKGVEFHLVLDRPQDSKKQAEIDNIYIRAGVKSVDEVRRELGLPPVGAPPRVYTTNGYIPLTEGDKPAFDIFQQKLLTDKTENNDSEPPVEQSA